MGIKDLVSYLKKTRPQTMVHIRNRFSDPRLKGKRVAIDATLLTNTFHFGRREEVKDGKIKDGKQALVGWYMMIREMRAAGVTPIAIWDQPGTREWKAAEAKKRLAARALSLARRNHEDERAARLRGLKDVLKEAQKLSEKERQDLQSFLVEEKWTRHGPPVELPPRDGAETAATRDLPSAPPSATPSDPARPPDASTIADKDTQESSGRLALAPLGAGKVVAKLYGLLQSYREHDRPKETRHTGIERETEEALAHVRDFEVFSGESAEPGQVDIDRTRDGKEQSELDIDEKIRELVPFEEYTETPTQQVLTMAEGRVIDVLLGVKSERLVQSGKAPDTSQPEVSVNAAIDDLSPWIRTVDQILQAAPEVRDVYARALKLPSRDDHEACRELLVRLGVPVLTAMIPYEAEGLASSLAKQGLVDYVGTEDSDVLGYEGPLLRNVGQSQRPLTHVSGEMVRESLQLSKAQYLDFCILLGNDAAPRIPLVGPVKSYKLITEHGSIENILENEPKIRDKIPEGYMDMVHSARQVFTDLPSIPADVSLEQGVWDEEQVVEWMEREHGLKLVAEGEETGYPIEHWEFVDDGRFEEVGDQGDVVDGEPDWEGLVMTMLEEQEAIEALDAVVDDQPRSAAVAASDQAGQTRPRDIWDEIVQQEADESRRRGGA